jgi:hypothetical protein
VIDLTQDGIRKVLHYFPETGEVRWRFGNGRNVQPWQLAGGINGRGYRDIKINGKAMLAHRLIWLYVHGHFPKSVIDHKNRIASDNRLSNLRDVSQTDNAQNIGLPRHNKSGHLGVSWIKTHKSWTVYIKVDGKNKWLGYYKDIEQAVAARKAGEAKYYNLPETENY